MAKEIKIRDLKNKDVWTVAGILVNVAENSDTKITQLISDMSGSDDKKTEKEKKRETTEKGIEVMIFVLKAAFKHARDELQEWFADLCEMEKEEFLNETGPQAMLEVIEQLKNQDDVEDFFSRVSAMFKSLSG